MANVDEQAEGATCPYTTFGEAFTPFVHDGMDEFLARARQECPVFYHGDTNTWVVTKREDALAIFKNPEVFSASNSQSPLYPFPPEVQDFLRESGFTREPTQANTDPPKHTRIREVAGQFLNARQFLRLKGEIRKIAREYIEKMKGEDEVDIVQALTYELPARVIFLLLGVPDVDTRKVKGWADNRIAMIWSKIPAEDVMSSARQLVDYWNYCGEVVRDRLANPSDDYPSKLLEIRAGEDSVLTLNEVQSLVFGILLAGHETTSNALASMLRLLLEDEERWQAVNEDRNLIKNAVEEVLRYDPPFVSWRRITTQETTIGGVKVGAEQPILIALASSNRDEEAVEGDPNTFDVARPLPGRHLTFGNGIHFCMGAPLARLEMSIVLEELLDAFPKMKLASGHDVPRMKTLSVHGIQALHVKLNSAS